MNNIIGQKVLISFGGGVADLWGFVKHQPLSPHECWVIEGFFEGEPLSSIHYVNNFNCLSIIDKGRLDD